MRGTQRKRERPAVKTAKRYGSSIFLETKQVAVTRPFFCERAASCNGFVSEDGSDRVGAATMPRNKSPQFRPAGTRVALPGTNVAHRIARAAFAGSFVLRFFPRSNAATSRENFLCHPPPWMLRLRSFASLRMTKLKTDFRNLRPISPNPETKTKISLTSNRKEASAWS
jgi:hypothetical protein